ncbi:uncharacterized [Tachysurus ichikawai]
MWVCATAVLTHRHTNQFLPALLRCVIHPRTDPRTRRHGDRTPGLAGGTRDNLIEHVTYSLRARRTNVVSPVTPSFCSMLKNYGRLIESFIRRRTKT